MKHLVLVLVAACSDTTPCREPAATGPFPAPHPALPLLVDSGGPVLAAPKVVPIFYRDEPYRAQLLDLAGKLGASTFWSATTAEYGIGALALASPVDLAEPPPATITKDQLETWFADHLKSGALGARDPDAIYTLYLPAGSSYTTPSGRSCVATDGFHAQFTVDGQPFAYAVIAACDTLFDLSGLDVITAISSHEWIEAATDPGVGKQPAFIASSVAWAIVFGLESADLCERYPGSFVKPPELGYAVQRSWSNARAAAGHDPCAPADDTYFAASPLIDDPQGIVHIAEGGSATIDVALWSDAATEPWSLAAVDFGRAEQQFDDELALSWDCASGQNGDTRRLTIHVKRASPAKLEIVTITAGLGDQATTTPLVIMN